MTAHRNLQAALRLAGKGLAVFPCKASTKIAVIKRWQEEATTDPKIITAWWNGWPEANVAVATGSKSGVFVLDVDMKHGKNGEAELRALEAKHGALPKTVELITPSGGRHLWFRKPEFPVRNSVNKIAPGLDLRGDGGYVLVRPSYVVEDYGAGSYTWSVDSASEFADAPDWLLALARSKVANLDERRPSSYWQRVICEGASEGARNATAASLAGYLLRLGIDREFGIETVLHIMLGWNDRHNRPPLPDQEIARTLESIAEREGQRRAGLC